MYTIGIDLGGTSTKLAAVASTGELLGETREPAAPGEPLPLLFARLRERAIVMAHAGRLPFPPPDGIGVGLAGIVNPRTGWLKLAGALRLADCDLRGPVEAAFGCRAAVECDQNAGALADLYFGQARGAENVLYVSWGTGIGAGLIVHRRLYHSRFDAMGEFGHTQVDNGPGRPCYCGCGHCLEAQAGAKAIEEMVTERLGRPVTFREIVERASAGEPCARTALQDAARAIARALARALVLFNPDVVVIGGGASHCFPLVRGAFDEELARRTPSFALRDTAVALSDFRDRAGVVGAALLPRHAVEA